MAKCQMDQGGRIMLNSVGGLGMQGEPAAWNVEQVEASIWGWAAWSDWSAATRGERPEASGSAGSYDAAMLAARRAARSMNPTNSFRVTSAGTVLAVPAI